MGKYIELSNDLNERNLKYNVNIDKSNTKCETHLQYSLNVNIVNGVKMVATDTAS